MKAILRVMTMLLCALLAACGDGQSDLSTYVESVKAQTPQAIEPLPSFAQYQPFVYVPGGRRAPFTPTRHRNEPKPSSSGIRPDADRPTEPLERFPLDTLHMVGTITSHGVTYALISAPDRVIHRVKRGDHLGQNNGRIQSVSDQGITITEIVADGSGGYTKHGAALAPSG